MHQGQEGNIRKGVFFAAGLAFLAALSLSAAPARAMALPAPAALKGAAEAIDVTEAVHYYGCGWGPCWAPYHRHYYRPHGYYRHHYRHRHYGYYRPYRYYRPYVPAPWVSGPWGYGPRYFHVGPWIGWF